MYIHILCVYVYMCLCIYICVLMYINMRRYVFIHISVYALVCLCTHVVLCVFLHVYVFMCICVPSSIMDIRVHVFAPLLSVIFWRTYSLGGGPLPVALSPLAEVCTVGCCSCLHTQRKYVCSDIFWWQCSPGVFTERA